jgi:hypothetical protein
MHCQLCISRRSGELLHLTLLFVSNFSHLLFKMYLELLVKNTRKPFYSITVHAIMVHAIHDIITTSIDVTGTRNQKLTKDILVY